MHCGVEHCSFSLFAGMGWLSIYRKGRSLSIHLAEMCCTSASLSGNDRYRVVIGELAQPIRSRISDPSQFG
ncbi:unnamed protein product [Protopolystoma xenopodis]|uniref:Uncharacterized protein n=1 Tax=Protopolystoma xenopodis TaxID=117903 RepID=A0A3S5BBM6_9PLAT|nr:unnamed protein product [Protopolystoma xenopodis]